MNDEVTGNLGRTRRNYYHFALNNGPNSSIRPLHTDQGSKSYYKFYHIHYNIQELNASTS